MGIEKVVLGLKHCAEDNCTGCPYEKGTSNCLEDLHIQAMQAIEALQWTNKQLIKTEKEKRRELWKKAENDLVDKIASFLEREENWHKLKNCWLENDRSDDLRSLLHKAIKE